MRIAGYVGGISPSKVKPDDKKLSISDINYVEKEFNEILFEDGYKTFFDYLKLKEYVKLVVDESD